MATQPVQQVHTYHCTFCCHLLLATTLHLPSLPTRRPPGLDNAIIAALPPPPRNPDDSDYSSDQSDSEEGEDEEEEDSGEPPAQPQPHGAFTETASVAMPRTARWKPPRPRPLKEYTLLLSSTRDRTPKIIMREDGYEIRYLWRCGRCKTVYGYQLDDIHYPSSLTSRKEKGKGKEGRGGGGGGAGGGATILGGRKRRKKKDYVYFLQGR
ncbi:hypothetical protein BDZ91DRAFT_730650 [Kalaharituber pfeilii]|nr:hypothetical protein BDZ91DRAFT_730650 [Kalaharituber pfeilii]